MSDTHIDRFNELEEWITNEKEKIATAKGQLSAFKENATEIFGTDSVSELKKLQQDHLTQAKKLEKEIDDLLDQIENIIDDIENNGEE